MKNDNISLRSSSYLRYLNTMPLQVDEIFDRFNECSTHLTECLWYLDPENKTKFFPSDEKVLSSPYSPMHFAAENNHVDAISFYLEKLTVSKNPGVQTAGLLKGVTPMHLAAWYGNLQIVKLIKNKLGTLNPSTANGYSVLHHAAFSGHLDIVKEIVKDLNENNNPAAEDISNQRTPLHEAARGGNVEVLKFFKDIVPDMSIVDSLGRTALHYATIKGKLGAVKYLADFTSIEMKSKIGQTPLHFAADKDHFDILKFFKEVATDMSVVCKKGLTALHYASNQGHLKAVTFLADFIDIDIKSENGQTAFDFASCNKKESVAKYLKYLRENPLRPKPITSLCEAAKNGQLDSLSFYHQTEPNMSIVDSYGYNALHYAAMRGNLGAVVYLVNFIDINIKNLNGNTATDLAKHFGHYSIIDYLKNWKKKPSDIKAQKECHTCFEELNGDNWGLVHGETSHAGYCRNCARRLKNQVLTCPQCRANIEAIIKIFSD